MTVNVIQTKTVYTCLCHTQRENKSIRLLRTEAVVKIFLPPFGCDLVRPAYVVIDSKLFSITLSFYFRAILRIYVRLTSQFNNYDMK